MPGLLVPTPRLVRISMLAFAFLLPFLTWQQAAGCALLALLFDVFLLPRLELDLSQPWGGSRPATAGAEARLFLPGGSSTRVVLYPLSILALIVLYRHHMDVVVCVWAILALGDGMAGIAGEALGGPPLPHNPRKTWSGFGAFVLAGTTGVYTLLRWADPDRTSLQVLTISLLAAIVGAIVEAAPIELDDDISVPLVCGGFVFGASMVERSALDYNLPYLKLRIVLAVVANLLLAAIAVWLHLVSRSGAAAGFLLGVAVYMGYGYKSFLVLLSFFVLGSVATRLGYAKKAALGVAERRGGARSWREAVANLLAGAFFSVLVITTPHQRAFLLALVAVFAEAAGDTVSSEIGQWVAGGAYRITTLQPVPVGENGGISFAGTAAGFAASALIAILGYSLGLVTAGGMMIAFLAGLAGNLFDSVLGATIERRGLITNGIVNFAGTSLAGGLALAVYLQIGF